MAARKFKAQCLKVIDEVHDFKEEVIVTKRGKPMARMVPAASEPDEIFGFMKGKGGIVGDLISPVDTDKWNSEK